jgi:hypothetical protein
MRQFEILKGRPPGWARDHWFVIISGQEWCDSKVKPLVNGLACFTVRGQTQATDVVLDRADGFDAPTACACDFFFTLEKSKLHSGLGLLSWERQQQIKTKVRTLLRLL